MTIESGQADKYAARTDVGKVRDHNEDFLCVDTDLGLYVLADGMGGHASGEVASEIAVTAIVDQVRQGSSLVKAIEMAHAAILEGVAEGVGKKGMGTTIVAVKLLENNYTLAWVGDSRAYGWDDGLTQISKDHSLVQMLLDSGKITKEEARVHPRKNIIYQNLGAAEMDDLQVSLKRGVLYKGQKMVLCSDGLSDEVDDEQIGEIIASAGDDKEAVDKLIAAAIDNGGNDNVSVIVISAPEDAVEKAVDATLIQESAKDTLVPDQ